MTAPGIDVYRKLEFVAIGASAGGIDALLALLSNLPAAYPLPIAVVLHMPEEHESQLANIFSYRTDMTVKEASDKETIQAGTLYFACPGYHLSVERDRSFSLSCEAPVHFSRPSIDYLMESAAQVYGETMAGIVLTGANQDGALGLSRVAEYGGLTIVQDPDEAHSSIMPKAAIAAHAPDFVLPLKDIRALLCKLKEE